MLLVPSEQIPSNALKDKSLKMNAGLKMEEKTAPSMKITTFAHLLHVIARTLKAKILENSVIAIVMMKKKMLQTQLKTSKIELTHKLIRQSVTFSVTLLRDVFQAVLRDALPCEQETSIIYDYITN